MRRLRYITSIALLLVGAALCVVQQPVRVKAQFNGCPAGFCNGSGGFGGPGFTSPGASSGPWTPLSDAGLVQWLEGDSGTFSDTACTTPATNGNTMGCWADKSSNGYNETNTNTSSQFPTYNTNQLNSLPVVTFAKANSTCLFTGLAQVSLGGTTLSGFALIKTTSSTAGSDRFVSYQANGQGADWNNTPSGVMVMANTGNTTIAAIRGSSLLSNGTVSAATFTQVGSIYDGSNNTAYIAGTAQTSAASTGSFGSTGQLATGCFTQGGTGIGNPADVVVAAVYVTKSTNMASNIETYWFNKWGVH